jgi:Xaa-Pro dipeptidase
MGSIPVEKIGQMCYRYTGNAERTLSRTLRPLRPGLGVDVFELTLDERDRRWQKVRTVMERRGLECLILWGSYGRFRHFGANIRYLSNISAEGYLIFPLKGDPTLVMFFARPDPAAWVVDGRTGHPNYSKVISDRMKDLHLEKARIGVIGLSGYDGEMGFPYAAYASITGNFPRAQFEDATDILTEARLIKGPDEIRCLELGCEVADKMIQVVADTARAGVPDSEVRARVMDGLFREGCEPDSMFLYHSGKEILHAGQGGQLKPAASRTLEKGDIILVEVDATYLGYVAQFNQPFSIGQPDPEWEEIFRVAAEAFNRGLKALKPGITTGELYQSILSPIKEAGYVSTNPAFHGLGLGLEDPVSLFPTQTEYKPDTSLRMQPGMVVEFEPHVVRRDFKKGASLGSPVLVTETGCRLLSKEWKPVVRIAG